MAIEGRIEPGTILRDWLTPPGYVVEVVAVSAGKLPTPIDPTVPPRGSTAGQCALFSVGRKPSAPSPKLKGAS